MQSKHATRLLPAAACVTLAAGSMALATPAQAFDFSISGQVSRAVTAVDNGEDSDIGFVDHSGDDSQFRFTGSQEMSNGSTVGFTYEMQWVTNDSFDWDVNSSNDTDNSFDQRIADVWIKGDYGKFSFGKIDGAADGSSELGYSNTVYYGGGSVAPIDLAGSVTLMDDHTGAAVTGKDSDGNSTSVAYGNVKNNFDGLSRRNGVRYDTPSFNGLTLSASVDSGHAFEIAPRYEKSFGNGGKFGVVLDYVDSQDLGSDITPNGDTRNTNNRFQEYGGSVALLLPSGVNFAAAYKRRSYAGPHSSIGTDSAVFTDSASALAGSDFASSSEFFYGGVGYNFGKHGVLLDYNQTDDLLNDGSEGKAIGLAYAYDWTSNLKLFASYHHYMADVDQDVDFEDLDQLYAGVILRFL